MTQELTSANPEKPVVDMPWGNVRYVGHDKKFWIKMLTVNPLQRISVEIKENLDIHWIVTEGYGVLSLDDQDFLVKPNDTIFIPSGAEHKVMNYHSEEKLVICELGNMNNKNQEHKITTIGQK